MRLLIHDSNAFGLRVCIYTRPGPVKRVTSISPDVRLRSTPCTVDAQNAQPIAQPAAPKEPAAHPVAPAPAKDDPFAAWDRAPVQAQPVTPAAPKPAAPAPEAADPAPKAAAPVQPEPAAQPAAEAADPLLAYLNSTPAAPAEPETPKPDDGADGSADGAAYSLDDILAEFSDF